MAAPKKKEIELLPKEEWEKSSFGKFLKWALGVGRYIVIITELVVIIAFISRFKLDKDLLDVNEQVGQKQALIEANQQFETEFRLVQKKLLAVVELEKEQEANRQIIEKLVSLIPLNVSLSDLSVNQNQVNLTASALSEEGLASFLKNLKASSVFQNIVLSNVTSGSRKEIGIQFKIKTGFKPKAGS